MEKRASVSSWAIGLVMVWFTVIMVRWPWQGGTVNIRSDVEGYWGYLRALFITHDLGRERPDDTYLYPVGDRTLNKYFCGESVMLLPFFLVAHSVAGLGGWEQDGYSLPYQRSVHFAALTYALIGLLCLRALLARLGVRDGTIAWVVVFLGFGTQLLQYTALQPGWTHVYSFCLVNALLLLMHRLDGTHRALSMLLFGALFGLNMLVRPTLGIVLLALPVVHGSRWREVIAAIAHRGRPLLGAIVACASVLSVQALLWHAQTGHWIENGYRDEGFYWSRPRFLEVLIGFRRGLFIWTPVLIAVVCGMLLLWKKDRTRAVAGTLYFIVATYVISAWWIPYYGGGFGHRAFIEHYAVLLIPFALWCDRARPVARRACLAFALLASGWHLMQFWQYNHYLLNHECMDRERYVWALGRFDPKDRDRLGGNDQEPPYHPNGMSLVIDEHCDLERPCRHWRGGNVIDSGGASRSGSHACLLDSATEFSTTFVVPAGTLPVGRMAHLEIELQRYEARAGDSFEGRCVISVAQPGVEPRYVEAARMNPVPGETDSTWRTIRFNIPVRTRIASDDELRFYIWNPEGARFTIDDLHARLFSVNPY